MQCSPQLAPQLENTMTRIAAARARGWLLAAAAVVSSAGVLASTYDMAWYTIDGGGGTSIGGAFDFSGTIGQPDAQQPTTMSGGSFELAGGYWHAPTPCLG